jgi:two-component system, NarL family, response regulator NreC
VGRIRVLIADDHALVRSGLRALLEAQPDMEVVGEAADGLVVETRCRELSPDVVLMDLTMPGRGGIAAAADVRRASPTTRILVLTMHEDEAYARLAASAGIEGYVLKRALAGELVSAIRSVHAGGRQYPPELRAVLTERRGGQSAEPAAGIGIQVLSDREREVVGLIALGYTNAEIGKKLFVSEKTVETHRAKILNKLELRTRADLVRFSIEHGLMKP